MKYIFKCGCVRDEGDITTVKGGIRCPDHKTAMTHKILTCSWCWNKYNVPRFHGHISGRCHNCKDYLTIPESSKITGLSEDFLIDKLEFGLWKKHIHLGETCLKRRQVYSIKRRMKAGELKEKKPAGNPCDKYNCAYRGQCLGTRQFYEPCSKYRPEYEAGDFLAVKMDLYERTLEGGVSV